MRSRLAGSLLLGFGLGFVAARVLNGFEDEFIRENEVLLGYDADDDADADDDWIEGDE